MSILKKLFGRDDSTATPEPPPARPAEPEPAPIRVKEVLPEQLKTRLESHNDLVVVDMRQGWEYQSGHIPGALHMFIQDIPGRMNELPKDKDVVFQCWHGNTSLDASAFLIQNGWDADRVMSLSGGMAGWVNTFGRSSLVKE